MESISSIEDSIDEDIFNISKDDSIDKLTKINELLNDLTEDNESIIKNNIKRLLHTIKGDMGMSGANKVRALTHRIESLLEIEFIDDLKITMFDLLNLITFEFEKIVFLIENYDLSLGLREKMYLDKFILDNDFENNMLEENLTIVDEVKVVEKENIKEIKGESKHFIRMQSNAVDNLINDAGEIRLLRTTFEGLLNDGGEIIGDVKNTVNKLIKMVKELEVQADTQMKNKSENLLKNSEHFDPLEFDRYTRLQELTKFISEAVADTQDELQMFEKINKNQLNAISQQSYLTNNLLSSLMNVRLVPVQSIEERLYKTVRTTAKELNKKVNLEIIGGKIEIDRLVLDKVITPLEHLIRNCISHGIELPEEREYKDKNSMGEIKFEINLEGNFIYMKISDDGAGINLEKIEKKALEKGLIKEVGKLSKEQLIELIFESGFSTAESVSQISGRGVGMDIVKTEINGLGGNIKVSSEQNIGTVFTIVLPVSVATNQVILIENNDKIFAIPALIIDEVISIKEDALKMAYQNGYYEKNSEKHNIYYFGHLIGAKNIKDMPEISKHNLILKVSYLGKSLVVHIDKLINTTEVVIKSLGGVFNKIEGFIGATMLGDGRQGLVINPVTLRNHFEKNIKNKKVVEEKSIKEKDFTTVMVVDDSLTVRRATSKILERYGYNIILAIDGEDALEKLEKEMPDIILSDVEMPRMDGFVFVKNLKDKEEYKNIPVIMITSRTADKHKKMAFDLGVDEFLGKPYKEDELIKKITEHTRK